MKFKPGHPKLGGRQKGTPNKSNFDLAAKLQSLDFDITRELREVFPKLTPEMRAKVLLELHEYIYPKRKALDVTATTPAAQAMAEHLETLASLPPDQLVRMAEETIAEVKGSDGQTIEVLEAEHD